MQNEISSKVSESEVVPDSFFEDLLDTVDETLIPITYDKAANLDGAPSFSSLCEKTTVRNITEHPSLPTTSKQFCNFPELTLGMEFSISEALFPKEMNLEECENDQEIISKKNKISEPNSSTKLKQTPKAKPEQKVSSYNILINSFLNDIKEISKENKNNGEQKQLASIKNKRNDAKNENTQKNDCETSAQHKLIDSPQSKESDEKSDNEQPKMKELEHRGSDICEEKVKEIPREVEIDDYKQTQNESKGLNIKESELGENQPSKDENDLNSATEKKCEGSLAESDQNDNLGSQCTNSKNVDGKQDDKSEKMTEKDQNNHFETHSIEDDNNEQISEEHPNEEPDEYLCILSEEYLVIQSDEYPEEHSDKQSEDHPDKQSEDDSDNQKVSKTRPQKRLDDSSSKQTEKDTHSKNQSKLKNKEEINSDKNKQSNGEKEHAIYSNDSEKESNDKGDQAKSKAKNKLKTSDESSSKQTKRNSDTISKNKVTKFKEIDSNDSEKESNGKDEQTKSKSKNKLKSSDESSSKQTKKDLDIISQNKVIKSKEIESNESERESDDDYQETKSSVKKKISSEESFSKQNKRDSNVISIKKLTRSNEIYFIESEKELDYDEKQTKSKAKNKPKSSDESFSNQSKKKLTKSKDMQIIDSDINEYKQPEQAKSKFKKKIKSPDKHHRKGTERYSNTPSKKRLIETIEIDSDESENKDSDEQTKSNGKKKKKKIDETSSKHPKKDADIISKKKLTTKSKDGKNIDSDGGENQVFEVDFEQEKSKAKNKLDSTDGNSCKISESRVTKLEGNKDSSDGENAQSDAEDEQIDFKAKKEVKNVIEKDASKNSRQQKLKFRKEKELEKSSKKQSRVPQTYKRKNKNFKENVSSLLKNNQLDDKDKHALLLTDYDRKKGINENIKEPLEKDKIEQIYSSQIKPCKIVLERLKNIDIYIPVEVPISDTQLEVLKKQKENSDKCSEKSKSKPEKVKLKGKKRDIYVCNSEGTCDESVSKSDVEPQSNDADSKVLAKPKERQYLDKHVEKIKGKKNILEKGKNNVSDQNSKKTLSESKSKPAADEFKSELKIKQEQQPKKNVKKSNAKLGKLKKVQLKGKNNNASVYNNEEISSEIYSKPVTDEAQSNDAQIENRKEKELFKNQTDQSKAKLKKFDSVKLKGKKNCPDHKETSSESVCNLDTDESQSEVLNKSKGKQHSKKLVGRSETNLEKVKENNIFDYDKEETSCKGVSKSTDEAQSKVLNKPKGKQILKKCVGKSQAVLNFLKVKLNEVKLKGKKDVSEHNNEETSIECVSELDTDEAQSDAGQSKVLDIPKNKQLLAKNAENSKSKLKKLEKVKLKGKKYVSVRNSAEISSESESELDADKSLSEELKQKEYSEEPIEKSEAKFDKSEKVKGKKDASEHNNEKTPSECVAKLDTDEAQLDAGQSEVLDIPNDKQLFAKHAEYSKSELKKLDKVKLKRKKDVWVCNSAETSSESESELDADKSQSEELKQKEHSEKPVEESEANLEKSGNVKEKKDLSENINEETSSECISKLNTEAQSDAGQTKVLDAPEDKQILVKHAENSKAKLKKLDKVKNKDLLDHNSEGSSSERESKPDETQSEELKKPNLKQRFKKPVQKSDVMLEISKEKKDHSNEETSCEDVSKPDTNEAHSNAGQSEILDKAKEIISGTKEDISSESEFMRDSDEPRSETLNKSKQKQHSVKPIVKSEKRKKDESDQNNKETSGENESKSVSDETQSKTLKNSKEKQHSEKLVVQSEAKLKKSEKVKEKKLTVMPSDQCNEETSNEGVSKLDADEPQTNDANSEVLDKLNDKQFLKKQAEKGKAMLKKIDKIKFKGKEYVFDNSEVNSSGNKSEPVSDETQSKAFKKTKEKQFSEKPVENSEKVKGKKDALDHCNEETSNEGVLKLDSDEAKLNADQSLVLDEPINKPLLGNDAEKSKTKMKKFDNVKFKGKKNVCDLYSKETLGVSESEPESDKSQSKKIKHNQQSKKIFNKSNIKLSKLEKVEKNDASDHNIEIIILSDNDSKPDADEKLEKRGIKSKTDSKKVEKNFFPKSTKRKFEHAEEIESLKYPKLKPCNVVIEQCDFSVIENTLNLDKNITLQVPKKNSIVEEEELTDISRNADIHIAIADQYQTETNASAYCEDENKVENETIYIVEDEEDMPTDITNNIQSDDSEEIDHSLSNCIVAVGGQHKKNASAFKENDEEEENTSNIQSKDIDCNQSDYTAAVEDKCKNEKAKKPTHGEKEVQAEAPCNIQSQDSKRTSKAIVKKSSKFIAGSESEKRNDLNEISASTSKEKDLESLEKRQTVECQSMEDCTSTVRGCEQSKEPNEKKLDSMNNSEDDLDKEKSSDEGAKASENVELEKIHVVQSKLKDFSTNQNLKAISQGIKASKEMPLEVFEDDLIISDENQAGNISDESVGMHSKKISTNKLANESKRLSIIKPCSVILEKFGSSGLKSNVDESDDFLSSNYEENSEDKARKGKKHSSKQKRLSRVSFSSKRKHKTDISDEGLNSSCSDSEKSFEDKDVKYSKTKRQSNKLKQSSYANSLIKRKHKHVISDLNKDSDSSCNDFKGSSESEDVKDSRKKKQSNIVKSSSFASSPNKRKHIKVTSDKSSSCSDSKESSNDEDAKDNKKKEQSNLLKPSSSATSPNKRKRKRVTSDEGSSCSDSKERFDKSSRKKKLSNKLKQFIRVNSSNKRKRRKDTSDESTSCCSSSEESSEDEDVKIKREKQSYKLKQLVRNLADNKIVRHLSCKSCKLSFKTYRRWVKHDKEFHKSFVYKCDLCYGELFKSHSSYVNHMKYFHPYEKLFFCKYRKCKKSFSSLKKFRHHHKSHYKFMCKYCKEGFMKEYQVYGHVIKSHVK